VTSGVCAGAGAWVLDTAAELAVSGPSLVVAALGMASEVELEVAVAGRVAA
jgi:hypothetical protein